MTTSPVAGPYHAAFVQRDDDSILHATYAAYAPIYDRRFAAYSDATLSAAMHALDGLIRPSDRHLLDVACGTGLLAVKVATAFPSLAITGVDLSAPMLRQAQRRLPDPRFVWRVGRAESLPVPDASVDLLTCTNAFHLVRDQARAAAEFRRVLAPGGRLVVVDWRWDSVRMRLLLAAISLKRGPERRVLTTAEAARLFESAGFHVHRQDRFHAGFLWDLMLLVAEAPGAPAHRPVQSSPESLVSI
jgi:ubiquinone/menaquinone biosynthesis C-methylase UbiE